MKHFNYLFLIIILFISVSCGVADDLAGGGIGGTGINNDVAGGGIGGTGISMGKITQAGSTIKVNGVSFDTGSAVITVDGSPGKLSDLRLGMIVTIRGTFNDDGITGKAESIDFKDNLEGPVEYIDIQNNIIKVLGKTILIDNSTYFQPTGTGIDDLIIGNIVEVSGFTEGDNSSVIRATYIENKATVFESGTTEIEIKGVINTLDVNTSTFYIGTLKVDFTNAILEELSIDNLKNGLFVEVKSTDGLDSNGVLISSVVEAEKITPDYEEGDKAEVEGLVTSFSSPYEEFEVNGQPVSVSPHTQFENGTVEDIALNVKLEVEGNVDPYGVLIATEISIEMENSNSENPEDETDSDILTNLSQTVS